MLQEYEKDERYGWKVKKKKVRWHSLQVKLRKWLYVKLEEELKEVECKMDDFEQGLLFDEEEARDVEEQFIDRLTNWCISFDQHAYVVVEASNEETYVFSSSLCVIACLRSDNTIR